MPRLVSARTRVLLVGKTNQILHSCLTVLYTVIGHIAADAASDDVAGDDGGGTCQ